VSVSVVVDTTMWVKKRHPRAYSWR